MADYPLYTKREFLKILGLGIAFLPLIGCFETRRPEKKETDKQSPKQPDTSKTAMTVSDSDVQLLLRNDAAYASYNEGFNKRFTFLPKYIAVCFTEKGIQYAVNKAREEGLAIAVKSGGHSFEGFSSNNGGMVINLSQMKKISWLSDAEVQIEPGALLQELHTALFPKNKLLPSGSCGTVAIAGLTLGGGYGFFSRKHGLTCDSLLQVRMVAADGKIYDSDQDQDLLWACKGGGNGNFGVVSSFRFKVYEAPETFSSLTLKFRKLNANRFAALLQQWFAITTTIDREAFSAFVLNGTTLTILATTYRDTPKLISDFQALTETADSAGRQLDQPLATAMKRYYGRKGPIYFKNASAGLYKGIGDLEGITADLFSLVINNPGMIFQINTLGGHIADPALAEASCYPHRAYPYLGELQAYWEQSHKEPGMVEAFEQIQQLLQQQGVSAHYRNYPDINFKDWENGYYGPHYKKLQEVKQRYDQEDLFRYAQSIRIRGKA